MVFVLFVNFHRKVIVRWLRQTVLFVKNVKYSDRFGLNQIYNTDAASKKKDNTD